jgi:hypothetical protein
MTYRGLMRHLSRDTGLSGATGNAATEKKIKPIYLPFFQGRARLSSYVCIDYSAPAS